MRLYQARLAEGGIFCAWVNETHFIPKTAATVFPYSEFYGGFLVSGNQPISYDREYMRRSYENYLARYSAYLDSQAAKTMSPEIALSSLRATREQTLQIEAKVPPLTDLTPWLEYYYLCQPQFLDTLRPQQLKYCYGRH